ncbi:MAG: biotin transporter BioY, partial [Defluviitaleaceae bacterium]|nr:biotin transporter BioY [Defluviitaleaceae bacterium]
MLPKYGSGEKRIKIRELCHIGIFVALIAVCAQIAIPLPGGVPITLQAWAISLAGLVLGAKNGAMAALVYVLLGAAG